MSAVRTTREMSYDEVAEALDMSPRTVKRVEFEALRKLRLIMYRRGLTYADLSHEGSTAHPLATVEEQA